MLEQEKIANANLVKEIDHNEKALPKAQEKINHHDEVVAKVEAQIKNLE